MDKSATADLAVATKGLTKRFRGGQVAVNRIDLEVPRGAVFGFLGPNGSGKTTTIRMLLGLIRPTDGTHALLGLPMPDSAASVLPRVGALVEGPAFHPHLSGWDNLRRLDAADRTADPATEKRRIEHALDRVGLMAAAKKRYRNYSLGMRQRLAIAAGLLQPRELLILDEPTNGLDPQGTREVRSLISELADGGATIMLSTHLLAEVEQICTHVGVMHVGNLITQGTITRPAEQHDPAGPGGDQPAGPGRRHAQPAGPHRGRDRAGRRQRRAGRGGAGTSGVRAGARRRAGAQLHRGRARPGGRVRLAHRGGLRCQRLR